MGLLGFLKKKDGPAAYKPLKKTLRLPLVSLAVLFALLGCAAYVLLELRDLNHQLGHSSSTILDLAALASQDALILEDRQDLGKIVDRIRSSNEDLELLAFENEEGEVLASWKADKKITGRENHSFSKEIIIGGQKFGKITVKATSKGVQQQLIGHALIKALLFPASFLLFFFAASVIIDRKVFKPIGLLYAGFKSAAPPAEPLAVGNAEEFNTILKALTPAKAPDELGDIAAQLAAASDEPAEQPPAAEAAPTETSVAPEADVQAAPESETAPVEPQSPPDEAPPAEATVSPETETAAPAAESAEEQTQAAAVSEAASSPQTVEAVSGTPPEASATVEATPADAPNAALDTTPAPAQEPVAQDAPAGEPVAQAAQSAPETEAAPQTTSEAAPDQAASAPASASANPPEIPPTPEPEQAQTRPDEAAAAAPAEAPQAQPQSPA